MDVEQTLVLIKPDAVQRGLAGEIITRYEKRGLRIAGMKLLAASEEQARRHYHEHEGKSFFPGLVAFITSRPLVAMVLEGPNAIQICRDMNGKTKPWEAAPGTIRGDFALDTGRNLVHASDGAKAAEAEIAVWFPEGAIAHPRDLDPWIVEPR